MRGERLAIPEVILFQPKKHGDDRGFFLERFRQTWLTDMGIHANFVQDNHSKSAPGVLRGLHYQTEPSQAKLVTVFSGSIFDVVVDIRKNSPTFMQSVGIELSAASCASLWVPHGFAHGFCVLGNEPAEVFYKVTGFYNPHTEGGIKWDDPDLKISWPIKNPTVSQKDKNLPPSQSIKPL
ncbi:MAG: dTDP-4-dehydrorhamnose 3,5-epimerase [Oligoflexia bacterium]|nr:dTDP-4-dehydrorhamnose 3,5-epimerase [Oligoflexia bacterium]